MKKILCIFSLLCFSFVTPTKAYPTNNTVFVTLATSEFGEAICSLLASEGYDLLISGRNKEKLSFLQKKLQQEYPTISVQSVLIDFLDTKSIEIAARNSCQSLQGIVLMRPRPVVRATGIPSKEEWLQSFQEAFINPLEVIRFFGPKIKNNGSIVIIIGNTSKFYTLNYPNINNFGVLWGGELKNLMYFFAPRNIRVNAISPGPILTQYHITNTKKRAQENGITFEEQLKKDASSIPLKTYGKVEDIAFLVSFLLSTKSNHINGENIAIDGGEFTSY